MEKVNVTEEVAGAVNITLCAHHASKKRCQAFELSIAALLPLLQNQAHSVATIRHMLDKIRDTSFLNPDKVPVIAAYQPIYALAKQILKHWIEHYGEDKYSMSYLSGELHIELAALRSIGNLLQNSGWTGALAKAGVVFMAAANITRTRQMHQITACNFYKLMNEVYTDCCAD